MSSTDSPAPAIPLSLSGLTPREAIADVLHRACLALDLHDRGLWESAWLTSDPSIAMEISGRPPIRGWADLCTHGLDLVAHLDTQHVNTGLRIDVAEGASTARLTCQAQNQHYRAGEGRKPGAEHLLAGSRYDVQLMKDGKGEWRMRTWKLSVIWAQGSWAVMQPHTATESSTGH